MLQPEHLRLRYMPWKLLKSVLEDIAHVSVTWSCQHRRHHCHRLGCSHYLQQHSTPSGPLLDYTKVLRSLVAGLHEACKLALYNCRFTSLLIRQIRWLIIQYVISRKWSGCELPSVNWLRASWTSLWMQETDVTRPSSPSTCKGPQLF